MRTIALIILIMCTIIEIHGLYSLEKSLRQREQIIRKAEGIMFVYDITKGETFDTIEEYMKNETDIQ